MSQKIKIELASVPDREGLVAELWLDQSMLAELRKESGRIWLQLYAKDDGKPWDIEAQGLIDAVNNATMQLKA